MKTVNLIRTKYQYTAPVQHLIQILLEKFVLNLQHYDLTFHKTPESGIMRFIFLLPLLGILHTVLFSDLPASLIGNITHSLILGSSCFPYWEYYTQSYWEYYTQSYWEYYTQSYWEYYTQSYWEYYTQNILGSYSVHCAIVSFCA